MRNDGRGGFVDVAKTAGDHFRNKYVGRGATFGDFDNDGDLDLLVVNLNDSPRLLRNDGGNRNHWLIVAAKLPGGRTDAVGARVAVTVEGASQMRELVPVTGYLSQADPRAHFGLATAGRAEQVEVRWPGGGTTRLKDVAANQILTVVQDGK